MIDIELTGFILILNSNYDKWTRIEKIEAFGFQYSRRNILRKMFPCWKILCPDYQRIVLHIIDLLLHPWIDSTLQTHCINKTFCITDTQNSQFRFSLPQES